MSGRDRFTRFLGLPLKQIRDLLEKDVTLGEALRRQQYVLADKRRQIDAAIHAIRQAEQSLEDRRGPDWELFKRIIRVTSPTYHTVVKNALGRVPAGP